MKTLKYKFEPGQLVFWVSMETIPIESKCPICIGEGYLLRVDIVKVPCTQCHGKGTINNGGKIINKVFSGVVNLIHVWIEEKGAQIIYNVCRFPDGVGCDKYVDELYEKLEDAAEECDKKSKEGAMGYQGPIGITTPK